MNSGGFNALIAAVLLAGCQSGPPNESGPWRESDLVEIVKLDPTLRLDVRYATTNNFLRRPVYAQARVYLQRPAAQALGGQLGPALRGRALDLLRGATDEVLDGHQQHDRHHEDHRGDHGEFDRRCAAILLPPCRAQRCQVHAEEGPHVG